MNKDYQRNFENGKPTDAFKRRSKLYSTSIRSDGTTSLKFNNPLSASTMNKANCKTCDHKNYPEGGYCYMFKTEPQTTCKQHTGNRFNDLHRRAASLSDEDFKREALSLMTKLFAQI